jgi:hypothetical protein
VARSEQEDARDRPGYDDGAKLSRAAQEAVARQLREHYRYLLNEELPPRLMDLVGRI